MSSYACRTLASTHLSEWTRPVLETLTLKELQSLALLLGTRTSGTKARLVTSLLDVAALRVILAEFGDDPHDMADRYKLKELRAFAARAGTFRWSTKYGVSAGLLQWRNNCRRLGQAALREAQQYSRKHLPFRQLRLPDGEATVLSETYLPSPVDRHAPLYWLLSECLDKTRLRRVCLACGDEQEILRAPKGGATGYVTWVKAHLACGALMPPLVPEGPPVLMVVAGGLTGEACRPALPTGLADVPGVRLCGGGVDTNRGVQRVCGVAPGGEGMSYLLARDRGGDEEYHGFNVAGWREVLTLAEEHGWQPQGTQPPLTYNPVKEVKHGPWGGGYTSNDWQIVTGHDAHALGLALETAVRGEAHRSAHEAWWDRVERFAAFCREGGFLIG